MYICSCIILTAHAWAYIGCATVSMSKNFTLMSCAYCSEKLFTHVFQLVMFLLTIHYLPVTVSFLIHAEQVL